MPYKFNMNLALWHLAQQGEGWGCPSTRPLFVVSNVTTTHQESVYKSSQCYNGRLQRTVLCPT